MRIQLAALLILLPLSVTAAAEGNTKMTYSAAKKACLKEKPQLKAKELQTCIKKKRK
jgi:hypothetical protein